MTVHQYYYNLNIHEVGSTVNVCFIYPPLTKPYLQVSLQMALHAIDIEKSIIFDLKSFKTKPTYTPHGWSSDDIFYVPVEWILELVQRKYKTTNIYLRSFLILQSSKK
jgi:hypothetical protein